MQYPIFLVQGNELTDAVKQKIVSINPSRVYIIGLQAVVSASVEDQVTTLTGRSSQTECYTPRRGRSLRDFPCSGKILQPFRAECLHSNRQ